MILRKPANWLFNIVGSLLLLLVFLNKQLYGQLSLQIIYLGQAGMGLLKWNRVKNDKTNTVPIKFIKNDTTFYVFCLFFIITFTTLFVVDMSYYDLILTVLSVIANALLIKRFIESWPIWMIVDAFSIALFCHAHLYWTAALYLIFFIMSIVGMLQWYKELKTFNKNKNYA